MVQKENQTVSGAHIPKSALAGEALEEFVGRVRLDLEIAAPCADGAFVVLQRLGGSAGDAFLPVAQVLFRC